MGAIPNQAAPTPSFPQEPSRKAMKMSRLCLSIALLVLLGTLVAGIPGCDTSNQAKGESWLTSPLKIRVGRRRVHRRHRGVGVG